MATLLTDLRFALRAMARHPWHALVIVVTLGLGIGATTALYSVIHGVLLADLPYGEGERMVRLNQAAPQADIQSLGFSVPDITDLAQRLEAFDGVVEYHSMPFTFLGQGEPERLQTAVVGHNFFDLLGVEPWLGRTFRPEDDVVGAEPVLVLSHSYWQSRFGGDPSVLGSTFEMNDRIHTVVGVLPPLPAYPNDNALFMPTPSCPFRANVRENRQGRMLSAFARLAPGVSDARALADLQRVASGLAMEHSGAYPADGHVQATFTPIREELTRSGKSTFFILLGAAGFVLLLVCANVANLSLARLLDRQREMAVRVALGASRRRLVAQLVTESVVLSLIGAVLGLGLAASTLHLLVDFAARFTPRAQEVTLDLPVLFFTLAVAVLSGLLFGVLPALSREANLGKVVRGGTRTTGGSPLQGGLVVAQVGLSFVLLIGAGLMLRSFASLLAVDPGYAGQQVVEATVDLNWSKYGPPEQSRRFYTTLMADIASRPGVVSAALAGEVPLGDGGPFNLFFDVESSARDDGAARPRADVRVIGPAYFETLGIPLREGRAFTDLDHQDAAPVLIVNERLARQFWGDRGALQRRISFDQGQTWMEVVGVVPNVRQSTLDNEPAVEIYAPFQQAPRRRMSVLVRTLGDADAMIQDIRRTVHALDPEQPVSTGRSLEDVRHEALSAPRLTTVLIGLFAVLALVVTAAGLSGVIAFAVSRRTREIGIRLALGAKRREILGLVMGRGLWLVTAGLVLGLGAALVLGRFVESLLYQVQSTDLVTYFAVAALLATVAGIACLLPALRAANLQPSKTLRAE